MSREKRPAYFRFFLEACELISILDTESAGHVIHAVSAYFSEGTEPDGLNKKGKTVFNRIRQDVDKSWHDYEAAVTSGRNGAAKRYGGGKL